MVTRANAGQWDAFGPEAQRVRRERMIERTGLVRTGLEWSVAHRGRTIGRTEHLP